MNRFHLLAASALLAFAAACSKSEPVDEDPASEIKYGQPDTEADTSSRAKPGTGTASGAGTPTAGAKGAGAPDADEEAILKVVPTVEEAAAKAARDIDAANAEAMLAEIRKELDGQ
jgi:hypothetical protein